MINFIGCLTAFVLSLLISNVDSIEIRQAKILTVLGWLVALLFAQGGCFND